MMSGCLQGVLGRKLVVPEVYDVMTRIQDLLLRSHADSVRSGNLHHNKLHPSGTLECLPCSQL